MERSRDWLAQADNDLEWARHSAAGGFHAQACFAAQQAAEKAGKAAVQAQHGEARGHSVLKILRGLPGEPAAGAELLEAAAELDQYYIPTRYPNGFSAGSPFEFFTSTHAQRAIGHAERIIEFCRSRVPRS